jgi:hypothetical protein
MGRQIIMVIGIVAAFGMAAILFVGCQSRPGDKTSLDLEGPGIGRLRVDYERMPGVFTQLPPGWAFCKQLTAEGIPVCIFCSQPGTPPHPDIPAGCRLVDLLCNGGPFEVWCGETVVPQHPGQAEYTPISLRFHGAVGPTLNNNSQVTFYFEVHQDDTFPLRPLRGQVRVLSMGGYAYAPGGQVIAGSMIQLRGTASDLAYNLFYLGFDRLAFSDEDGRWEIVTLRHLLQQSGEELIDLPYVFLVHNGQVYSEPYDVDSN